jgi:ubiquinone/menaquinone biosynthesis C-methylase UbiE
MSTLDIELLDILACPICKGELTINKGELDCKKCNLNFDLIEDIPILLPRIYDSNQQHYYDETFIQKFSQRDAKQIFEGTFRMYSRGLYFIKTLSKFLPPPARILDIGCGALWPTVLTRKIFPKAMIVAVDLSYNMIKVGGDLMMKHFRISQTSIKRIVADMHYLPFKSNVFDAIISVGVLHHSDNLIKLTQELHRVLKYGGYLCSKEPTRGLSFKPTKTTPFDHPYSYDEYVRVFREKFKILYCDPIINDFRPLLRPFLKIFLSSSLSYPLKSKISLSLTIILKKVS